MIELLMVIAAMSAVALMAWVLYSPVDNWMFTQSRRAGFAEDAAAVSRLQKEIRRIKAPGQIQIFTAPAAGYSDGEPGGGLGESGWQEVF